MVCQLVAASAPHSTLDYVNSADAIAGKKGGGEESHPTLADGEGKDVV